MLRRLVSQDKVRFSDSTYDLDLSYINNRIIAMGFPSTGLESSYRNPVSEVARLLEENHSGHYKVYNLSEKMYHESLFTGPVEHFPFPDHHAPSFGLLVKILSSMHAWLKEDPSNVIAVHCIAGMGRTGTIISSLLQFLNIDKTAQIALEHFAHIRTVTEKGVVNPSQVRYVYYVEKYLKQCNETDSDPYDYTINEKKKLTSVTYDNLSNGDLSNYYLIVLDSSFDVLYNSSWITTPPTYHDKSITFDVNAEVTTDFTIKLFKFKKFLGKVTNHEVMRCTLNLHFDPEDTIILPKTQLDGPHKDESNTKFPSGLQAVISLSSLN